MARAFGFTVMIALIRSSYFAIRVRYCSTFSRDVVRFCSSAARMSEIDASTTEKGAVAGGAGRRWAVSSVVASSSRAAEVTRKRLI